MSLTLRTPAQDQAPIYLRRSIYANYPALGGLSRWADDRFVAAIDEGRKRLGNMDHLTMLDIHNVNGWSKARDHACTG
jgi:hypothetical protein